MGDTLKYLIAIDNDGTLSHSDGTISRRTILIINELVSKGNYVVICTARPRYYTREICKKVGASKFLISSNGSEVYDDNLHKTIDIFSLKTSDCLKIYEYAIREGIRIVFSIDNTEYATQFTRNKNQKLLSNNIEEILNKNSVKQCMVIGKNHEKILKFREYISASLSLNIIDYSNNMNEEIWFNVISNAASKGNALIKLCDYLQIPLKNTIAIGNSFNDISMLKIAGISVAVENSEEEVKLLSKVITNSNDDDGVAKFLEKL